MRLCGTKQQLYKKQHISFHFLVGGRLVARKKNNKVSELHRPTYSLAPCCLPIHFYTPTCVSVSLCTGAAVSEATTFIFIICWRLTVGYFYTAKKCAYVFCLIVTSPLQLSINKIKKTNQKCKFIVPHSVACIPPIHKTQSRYKTPRKLTHLNTYGALYPYSEWVIPPKSYTLFFATNFYICL
jgi:hypothetical protein